MIDMMNMIYKVYMALLVGLTAIMLYGCKADFSPNAEWREVPAVYCLLDQDDTVSYVRVQRCYLGDGDLKGYARVFDSTNYAEGELRVEIRAWRSVEAMTSGVEKPLRVLYFDYMMLTDKADGEFSAPRQPVYVHRNAEGDLDTALVYQLLVSHASDGSVVAEAYTRLVGDAPNATWLVRPVVPYGRVNFVQGGSATLAWNAFERGRRYQATVRYYYGYRYRSVDTLSYVEVPLQEVTSTLQELELSSSLASSTLLSVVETALRGDTASKLYYDTLDVFLSVANEDYNAYLNSIAMIRTSLDQELTPYSNIEGGVGVFGARRTRLRQRVLADNSDIGPYGLHFMLERLDVGFGGHGTKQ